MNRTFHAKKGEANIFNTYKSETRHDHVHIKMPEIPTEYKCDVYNHNKNDDVDRMDFYLRNNIPTYLLQNDMLRNVINEINSKVTDHMMKYYTGDTKVITVKTSDNCAFTSINLPEGHKIFSMLSNSIKEKFNINNHILINADILDGSTVTKIVLQDRANQ